MFVRIFPAVLVTASFALTAGCTGEPACGETCDEAGNDLDQESCEGCPDDTGTPATASFIGPPVTFTMTDGTVLTEVCTTHLGSKYSIATGVEEEVDADTYSATFGDKSLASEASANLPVHTLANGWQAITPPVTVPVEDMGVEPEPPALSLLVRDTWTCDLNRGTDPTHGTVEYSDGQTVYLPGVGTLTLTGMNLERIGDGFEQHGTFTSNTFAQVSNTGGMTGDYDADCWAGRPDDDPR